MSKKYKKLSPLYKKVSDSIELDEFHYHEMTDRLHVMMHSIDTHLQQHKVAEVETELSKHISKAVDHLWKAYQISGSKEFSDSEDKPISI